MKFNIEDEPTIIENGIKVYQDYVCEHCGKRIPWKKSHVKYGIPNIIVGHNCPLKGKHRVFSKEWKENLVKSVKKWHKKHPGVVSGKNNSNWIDGRSILDKYYKDKRNSKERGLDFIPLNEKNEIANEMHHLDDFFILFIPKVLHESFWHSVKTGRNLEEMNELAWKWFDKEGYKFLLNGNS